jgi:hypothetical protein
LASTGGPPASTGTASASTSTPSASASAPSGVNERFVLSDRRSIGVNERFVVTGEPFVRAAAGCVEAAVAHIGADRNGPR